LGLTFSKPLDKVANVLKYSNDFCAIIYKLDNKYQLGGVSQILAEQNPVKIMIYDIIFDTEYIYERMNDKFCNATDKTSQKILQILQYMSISYTDRTIKFVL
jgi:hypothetical protein